MAKPFGVLVCVYRVRLVLKDLFLLLKSHIWHGPECVTELGMSKGLCIRLLCVRVVLCCTLIGRIMQFFPELVKQCICVSFTKVMVGVHVMNYNLSCRLVKTRSSSACGPTLFGTLSQNRL